MTSNLMKTIKKVKKFNDKYNVGSSDLLRNIQTEYEFNGVKVRVDYLNSHYGIKGKDTIVFWNKEWRNNYTHDDVFFYWQMKYCPLRKYYERNVGTFGYDLNELEVPDVITDALVKTMTEVAKNKDSTISTFETNMNIARKEIAEHTFGLSRLVLPRECLSQ